MNVRWLSITFSLPLTTHQNDTPDDTQDDNQQDISSIKLQGVFKRIYIIYIYILLHIYIYLPLYLLYYTLTYLQILFYLQEIELGKCVFLLTLFKDYV